MDTSARWLVRLAWAYIASQFLPWLSFAGSGAHDFFIPSQESAGFYTGFSELAIGLAFAVVALVRLEPVAPRVRLALPEVTVALAVVTAVRILLPFVQSTRGSWDAGIGAFVGSALALALVVGAFADRRRA